MKVGDHRMRLPVAAVAVLLVAGCSAGAAGGGPSGSRTRVATSSVSPVGPTSTPSPSPGFRFADVTFVGDRGWALGTVGCATGRCTAFARSTDDGLDWSLMRAPSVHVSEIDGAGDTCLSPCVEHVRFGTDRIGYLFGIGPWSANGKSTLLMTTDGGRSWQVQRGGADALETLDGNVIRVVDRGNCPPGCSYAVQVAPVGATSWRTIDLPDGQGGGDSVQLVRTGSRAALEVYGNPAGGAPARAVLFTSADDGASWTRRAEPCPQLRPSAASPLGEVDSSRLTSAPDGSITVLCTPRSATRWQFTITSSDGGASFRTGDLKALGAAAITALGAASARTVLVSSDDVYRSTDSGHTFARLSANGGTSPGPVVWLGFASATVGHAISPDRRTVFTTTDAGRTWTSSSWR